MADANIRYKISQVGAEKVAGSFGKIAGTMGKTILAAVGVRQAWRFLIESAEKFKFQEIAIAKLDSAFGKSTKSLQRYASALQKVSTFGDEAIIEAQSLIASFVKEESQVKSLIKVTLDFAAAKKVELSVAADLITKTFASSTNALSRYGLVVEGGASSNKRLNSLLDSMSVFMGSAEAQAKTLTGQIAQLKNEIGDTQEEIGELVLPFELFFSTIANFGLKSITAYGRAMAQIFKDQKDFIKISEFKLGDVLPTDEQLKNLLKHIEELRATGREVMIGDKLQEQLDRIAGSANLVLGEVGLIKLQIESTKEAVDAWSGSTEGLLKLKGELLALEEQLKLPVIEVNELLKERVALLKQARPQGLPVALPSLGSLPGGEGILGGRGARKTIFGSTAQSAQMIKDAGKVGEQIFDGWASVLTSNMNTAWAEVFGEANSLFEQLVNSWADLLVKDVFASLFNLGLNFLTGGASGGIGGLIGGLFGGGSPVTGGGDTQTLNTGRVSSPGNTTIILQTGSTTMGQWVLQGNKEIHERRLTLY